jgi:esterase/lipase
MKNQYIKIDNIIGTLSYPDDVDVTSTDLPALLYLHGFASNQDEVNGFYTTLSSNLSSAKCISLRIDFNGFGQSFASMKDATISTMVNDSISALKYLRNLNPNFQQIGIIGFSLGAAIGMLASKEFDLDFLILLSPALNLKHDLKLFLGELNFNKLLECKQSCQISLPWAELELGKDFLLSLDIYSPLQSINHFANPILCIAGSQDFTLKNANAITLQKSSNNRHLVSLDGLDHIFNDTSTKSHLELVNLRISDWLEKHIFLERKTMKLR